MVIFWLPVRSTVTLPRSREPMVSSNSLVAMALLTACMVRPYWVILFSSSSTWMYLRLPPKTETSDTPSIRSSSGTMLSST